MDARMTKAEAALLLPLPRNFAGEQMAALREASGRASRAAAWQALARVAGVVLGWPARQRLRAELAGLTDRELTDIGLTRGDLGRVAAGELTGRRS